MKTDTRKILRVTGGVGESFLRDVSTAVATLLVVPDWVLTSDVLKVVGAVVWLALVLRSAMDKTTDWWPQVFGSAAILA